MPDRRTVSVTVYDGEQYDGDRPTPDYPTLLVDAIAWFQSKLALIPQEYQSTAQCEIDSTGGYEGAHYGHIEIKYSRLETDEEVAEREAAAARQKAQSEAQEIAALRVLQARYPNVS